MDSEIVGRSAAMQATCERILQIAGRDLPVMLRGEPGSGKTLIARTIHANSRRAGRALVKLHCTAVADPVLDASLFEGVTGTASNPLIDAHLAKASDGTLFLDEITELGPLAQDRLFGILTSHVASWQGRAVPVNVRCISWSSRAIDEHVAAGRFRRDLYEHLSGVTIALPSLRDRKADLPGLVTCLLERFSREHARRVERLSRSAHEMVMSYDWPGNVRELCDALERAVVIANGPLVHAHHLPASVQAAVGSAAPLGLTDALAAYERELLEDALRRARGVRSKAARLLRTTDRIFNYKLRKHGIDCRQFKGAG